jgi:hypothetical protein
MTEHANSPKPSALKKLAEHLAALDTESSGTEYTENDMLSLIVSGTLNGENISQRYPGFHQKLLETAELRQAFLDALEAIETERAGEMPPMPTAGKPDLSFLTKQTSTAMIETPAPHKWRAVWQRSLEQIQAVFSPPELAYRADSDLIEDPWYTLLRDEITTAGVTYTIALDCTLSSETENAFSTFLNLAVTIGTPAEPAPFPIRARLQWGDYQESVLITEEGRARFPDIPLHNIFDPALRKLQAGLNLTIETTE